jgi:hypothetical protein
MNKEQNIHPIAIELAEALHDTDSLMFYQGLAEQYAESLLKETLKKVLEVPNDKIKRSRAAYFNYLMQQHGHKKKYYPRY